MPRCEDYGLTGILAAATPNAAAASLSVGLKVAGRSIGSVPGVTYFSSNKRRAEGSRSRSSRMTFPSVL